MGNLGLNPGLGRSPGGGHGNPLQYSCLENPQGQRSLVGYSPWGHKEADMTKWLSTAYKGKFYHFFKVWIISKVFIEFVTSLLFHISVFWPWGVWNLSSLTRGWTCIPCIWRWNLNHWTTREVPHGNHFEEYDSVALSSVTLSCSHHHLPFPETAHLPNLKLWTHETTTLRFLLSQALVATIIASVYEFDDPEWTHTKLTLLFLPYFP